MPKNNAPRTGWDAGRGRGTGQNSLPGFNLPDNVPEINSEPRTTKERFIRGAQAIILRRVLAGNVTTADDVWRIRAVPEGIQHRVMGEAFGGLAKMGLIASVRHERSQRGERHGGFHQVWRVGDVKAARAYLSALVKSKDAITIIANKGKVR